MGIRYTEKKVIGNRIHVRRFIDLENDEVWEDIMNLPIDIVTIRAGEYGLDPVKDETAIWDIILYEGPVIAALAEDLMKQGKEFVHPLVSAPTLAEAREQMISLCRAFDEKHSALGGDSCNREIIHEAHVNDMVVNEQLIHLHRDRTKHAVFQERERMDTQDISGISDLDRARIAMIDDIRDREGV